MTYEYLLAGLPELKAGSDAPISLDKLNELLDECLTASDKAQLNLLRAPMDEATLAERICQLIEDENLRTKMGAAALERAKEFSLEKIIPQWTSLFEELMKSKKR